MEIVNDVLPATVRGSKTERETVCGPEIVPEIDAEIETVAVPREVLRALVFGADAFREIWNGAVDAAEPGLTDQALRYLDDVVAAGLVDPATGTTTAALDLALAIGGAALGRARPDHDDGEGLDAMADAGADNDDFEDDVAAAEASFRAPLPTAGAFAAD